MLGRGRKVILQKNRKPSETVGQLLFQMPFLSGSGETHILLALPPLTS